MSGFVGAQHEFHNAAFVQGWADRFVPTPPRIALFDLILERVSAPGLPNAYVLELGLGPGYMARHILERNPGPVTRDSTSPKSSSMWRGRQSARTCRG